MRQTRWRLTPLQRRQILRRIPEVGAPLPPLASGWLPEYTSNKLSYLIFIDISFEVSQPKGIITIFNLKRSCFKKLHISNQIVIKQLYSFSNDHLVKRIIKQKKFKLIFYVDRPLYYLHTLHTNDQPLNFYIYTHYSLGKVRNKF